MHVSLGGQSLANLCLRGYDKIHIPEFPKGDRGNRLEIPSKRSSIELKDRIESKLFNCYIYRSDLLPVL